MRSTWSLDGEWTAFVDRGAKSDGFADLLSLERSGLARAHATVPGTVEAVLQALGELPADLYQGVGVLTARQAEGYHYFYGRRFELDQDQLRARSLRLVFGGVDTLATYYVNGSLVGTSANMLVPVELEVGHVAHAGLNEVVVCLSPPCPRVPRVLELFEGSPDASREESLPIRKAPHMYGWDIMPRLISGGIWRGVRLEARWGPVLEDWVIVTLASNEAGSSRLRLATLVSGLGGGLQGGRLGQAEADKGSQLRLRLDAQWAGRRIEAETAVQASRQSHDFTVPGAALWWPKGYGEPACYRGRLAVLQGEEVVDEMPISFGVRTVELDRQPPEGGSTEGFALVVNGERVFCYGPNWVPLDACHSVDASLYPSRLALLEGSGANMVRCWGGNVYEDEAFFERTDASGIMVWQDFAMACAAYPQDEAFAIALKEEATALVTRLRRHPSLVLWCGDNEVDLINVWRGLDPDANRLTREVLPHLLSRLDPFRPYQPSSPYISNDAVAAHDLERHGEVHLWGPRDAFWSEFYSASQAPFVSEIGFMGLPETASLEQMFGEGPKSWWPPRDERWLVHATDPSVDWRSSFWARAKKTFERAAEYVDLGGPWEEAPIDDVVLASQVVQAEGFKSAIERARHAVSPERSGLIWWNLVDGWPQVSDSVVDYYGCKKIAYDFITRVQTPLLVSLLAWPRSPWGRPADPESGLDAGIQLYPLMAVNHSRRTRSGEVRLSLAHPGDAPEPIWQGAFRLGPGDHSKLAEVPFSPTQKELMLLDIVSDDEHLANHAIVGAPPFSLSDWRSWLPLLMAEAPVGSAVHVAGCLHEAGKAW